MIGTSCSGAGVPAAKIISDAGYAMVSPSNTAPALTDPGTRMKLVTCAPPTMTKFRVAQWLNTFSMNLGITKAAAIHDGDPYTEGLATCFVTPSPNWVAKL